MRRLMMLRHAKSARPAGVDDHQRPLTDRGVRDSRAMGTFMAVQGLRPDLVLLSDSTRTRETWGLARGAWSDEIERIEDRRLYHAEPRVILDVVREAPREAKALLIVGHNPGFADLAEMLVGSGDELARERMRQKFPTAALAVIDFKVRAWSSVKAGAGTLVRFQPPKLLEKRPA